ncbi:MAG: hypothetical protein PHD43_00475 [Methylococcales bacterium]|nr:hypothetical protein [Methylococcales bacterium]
MEKFYANVTVNLSHLASTLIMSFIGGKRRYIAKSRLYTVLDIAIKKLQSGKSHRRLAGY